MFDELDIIDVNLENTDETSIFDDFFEEGNPAPDSSRDKENPPAGWKERHRDNYDGEYGPKIPQGKEISKEVYTKAMKELHKVLKEASDLSESLSGANIVESKEIDIFDESLDIEQLLENTTEEELDDILNMEF